MKHIPIVMTVIGSRTTPADILATATNVTAQAMANSHIVRSGAAGGMDSVVNTAFEQNRRNLRAQVSPYIFIPWPGFNSDTQPVGLSYIVSGSDPKAREIAATIHPAWDRVSQGARKLHTRNIHQILGINLDKPSDLVLYWCQEDSIGNPTGGTATAVNLAKSYGIPCINMLYPDWKSKLIDCLNQIKSDR